MPISKRHGYLAPPAQARKNKADDNMARFTVRRLGHAAGLLLILLAAACATPPAPQVATPPPPGQARIWFYRLWDPSESLNAANIDVNGVYFGSVEPGSAFYRDVAPGVYQIAPQNKYLDCNQNTNVAVVPGQQVFVAVPCGLRTHRLSLSDEFATVLETFGVRGLDEIGSRYRRSRPSERALARNSGEKRVAHWKCIADFEGIC